MASDGIAAAIRSIGLDTMFVCLWQTNAFLQGNDYCRSHLFQNLHQLRNLPSSNSLIKDSSYLCNVSSIHSIHNKGSRHLSTSWLQLL